MVWLLLLWTVSDNYRKYDLGHTFEDGTGWFCPPCFQKVFADRKKLGSAVVSKPPEWFQQFSKSLEDRLLDMDVKISTNMDLLVTDVVMPGRLQGPALAQELRALDPHLSVIFMSGYSREASIPEDFGRNDDTRLTKPVSRSELERAIDIALARRGTRASAN